MRPQRLEFAVIQSQVNTFTGIDQRGKRRHVDFTSSQGNARRQVAYVPSVIWSRCHGDASATSATRLDSQPATNLTNIATLGLTGAFRVDHAHVQRQMQGQPGRIKVGRLQVDFGDVLEFSDQLPPENPPRRSSFFPRSVEPRRVRE